MKDLQEAKFEVPKEIRVYTIRETAEILKVSYVTVHKLLRECKLKGKKIGRWKITHTSIEEFINTSLQ